MFRVKMVPTGQGAWVAINSIVAVVPGEHLGTSRLVMRDQGVLVIEGISDEIGLAIAKMLAGIEPLVDLREPKA